MCQLDIKIEDDGANACRLRLAGSLDLGTYEDLDAVFEDVLARGKTDITVDLAGIEHLSSKGFGVFLEAMATVRSRNGRLVFVNPSPKARDVFEVVGAMLDSCLFD